MKKILVYHNRKCDDTYYDVSTEALELAAFSSLFESLDIGWDCYWDLKSDEGKPREAVRLEGHPEGCMCGACAADALTNRQLPNALKRWEKEKALYDKAKAGDKKAAAALMKLRKGGEYESWSIEEIVEVEDE